MNRPVWLQDDLKMIRQWWSTRLLAFSALCQSIGLVVAFVAPGLLFRDVLGRFFMVFILVLTICGIGAQFYRQNKLRVTQPAKAETMVAKDPP
jgi:uncharacterized membrane protein